MTASVVVLNEPRLATLPPIPRDKRSYFSCLGRPRQGVDGTGWMFLSKCGFASSISVLFVLFRFYLIDHSISRNLTTHIYLYILNIPHWVVPDVFNRTDFPQWARARANPHYRGYPTSHRWTFTDVRYSELRCSERGSAEASTSRVLQPLDPDPWVPQNVSTYPGI